MKLHMSNRPTVRSHLLRRLTVWMAAACFMAMSFSSFAGVFISVGIAPPPLPVYAQPVMPGAGYIWTPGYWAYGDYGYFWIPGTWVLAPYVGALWTPGYWGWNNGFYVFNAGYWGPHVGFYGGINYGYGYDGVGYRGGYWNHGRFNYNRNVGYNTGGGRVSYNGGRGGLMARPTPQDRLGARDRHMQPLAAQQRQVRMASQNRALRASVNHGAPAIAATPRAGAFGANGVVRARGTASPAMSAATARATRASTSRNGYSAPRSASYVPRNPNAQRSVSYNRANSASYARPVRSSAGYRGSMRPAASAYRPARPQAHAQVTHGGGNRGSQERH
ncbi:MAG: YXWGXW repeat-containing protein [Rhodanobacter sp.]